jgi:ubiquitin-protein ligase
MPEANLVLQLAFHLVARKRAGNFKTIYKTILAQLKSKELTQAKLKRMLKLPYGRIGICQHCGHIAILKADVKAKNYSCKECKPMFAPPTHPFKDALFDNCNLKYLDPSVKPKSKNWAQRILKEQKNFQILHESNPNVHLEFCVDNSRQVLCTIQLQDETFNFRLGIPIKYPAVPPLARLNGSFKNTNFKNTGYDGITSACLGELKKRWRNNMSISHFCKLFMFYLSASKYNERIEEVSQ